MSEMGEPEQFQGRIIFISMFNDIIWRSEDNERECNANSTKNESLDFFSSGTRKTNFPVFVSTSLTYSVSGVNF